MRILFIYPDVGVDVGFSSGIGILSAVLKREGHETRLLHVSSQLGRPLDAEGIDREIADIRPDLLCFSVTTLQWANARRIGRNLDRSRGIPVIVGGAHATSDPEDVISEPWVDMVCRGEGEIALSEVVRRLESGGGMKGVGNLYHREGGAVAREPLGPWVQDLDALPFEDRELFDYDRILGFRDGWAEVIVTRGCIFPCAYCFNHTLLESYCSDAKKSSRAPLSKKEYLRRRSVRETIAMLKEIRRRYGKVKAFTFVDDVLAQEGGWFSEFAARYREEIGLPYACTSHPALFNENVARLLRESGCKVVKMGVESGNEEVRRRILKRGISNEFLAERFRIAREFGLKPQSFNMIGIPGETIEQMMETVALNARMKPYIVWLSTFIPYPGSALYEECRRKGMLDPEKLAGVSSYREGSLFREEFLPALEFKKIRLLFRWHLNAQCGDRQQKYYAEPIRELSAQPDERWKDGTAERMIEERDTELDGLLRRLDIGHYVPKRYISIYWGGEYGYDLG